MGWSIGWDNSWQRDIGYSVPAICDHPKCNAHIDRGLSHVCGGQPYGGDKGCGLYFCGEHLWLGPNGFVCGKCIYYKKDTYKPKPEMRRWLRWKLNHESWQQWRDEHPKQVEQMKQELSKGKDLEKTC